MLADSPIDIKTRRQSGSGLRGEEKGQGILFDHVKACGKEDYSPSDQSDRDVSESVVECSRSPIRQNKRGLLVEGLAGDPPMNSPGF